MAGRPDRRGGSQGGSRADRRRVRRLPWDPQDNPILSFDISPGPGQSVALEPLRIANDFTTSAGQAPLPESVVSQLQIQKAQLLFAPTGGTDATGATVEPGASLAFTAVIGGATVRIDGSIGLLPYPHLSAHVSVPTFSIGPVSFNGTTLTVDLEGNPTDPKVDFVFDGRFDDWYTGTRFSAHVDLHASTSALNAAVALHIVSGQPAYVQAGAELDGSVYANASGFGFSAAGDAGLVVAGKSLGLVYVTYSTDAGALIYQLQQAAGQVAQAFKDAYGWTDLQVAGVLRWIHYGGAQIAGAISAAFNDSIAQATQVLEFTGESLATAIGDVRTALNATDTQIATALQQLGQSPAQIASVLQSLFGDSQAAVYNALQQIGMGGQSVLDAIAGFFNSGSYWVYANPWWSVPLYVDDSGGSQAPGNPIIQWTWNGGHNQDWYVLPADSGYAEIVNRNSGQCLSAFGGAGSQVVQYPCYGWTSQQWYLGVYPGQNLNYTGHNVTNRWSGLDLDVNGASTSAGAAIDTWYGNGGWNQWFAFEPAIG